MGHDIYGKRFIGNRGLGGWHTLGTVINEPDISVEEALVRAGISYSYFDAPLGATLPDGNFVHLENRKAVFREATSDSGVAFLGTVSDGYHYLQNYELAQGLDKIRTATGWQFETAGALQDGALVFMTLRTGKRTVFGDSYDTFIAVNDGKASGKALTVIVTPVREVCRNTVLAAEGSASIMIKLAHDKRVAGEYNFWLGYLEELNRAQDAVFTTMEDMARVKIDEEQAREIFAKAYPNPKKNSKVVAAEALAAMPELAPEAKAAMEDRLADGIWLHEYYTGHARGRQDACVKLFQAFNAGEEQGTKGEGAKHMSAKTLKAVGGTVYAALQAGTELADWGGIQRGDSAAASCLFGEAATIKRRLWNACADVAARS